MMEANVTTSSKSAPLSADSSAAVSGSQCVLEVCSDSAGRPHAAPDADSGDRSLAIDLSLNPSVQGISGAEDQYPDRYDKSRRERELLDPSARTSNNFPIQSIESPGVESSYDCSSSPHFPIDSRAYSADEHVEAPHYDSKEYSKTSRGNSGDGSGDLGAGSLPPKESAISVVQVDLTGASTNYQTKRIVGGSTDASIRDTGYSDRPTQQFSNSYEKGIGDSLLKVSSGVQHLDSSGGESVDSAVEELKCDLKATSSSDQFLDKSVCSSVEAVNSSEGVQLHNEEGDAAPEPLRPGEENPRASHPLLRTDDIGGYANEECYQTEDEDPVYCVILAGEYNGCISRIVAGPLSNGEYKMELIADDVSPAKSKDGKPVTVFLMKREFAMIDFEMKSEWTITVDGRMVTRKVFVPIIYDLQTEGVFYDSDFLIGSRAVVTVGFFEGFVGKLVCRYPAKDFYIIKLINENDTYFADSSTGSYLSLEIPSSGFVALDSEQNNGETNAFQSSECGIFSTPKYMSSMDFEVIKNNQDFLGCIDDSKIFSEKEIVSSEKVLDLVHILTGMLEGFVCRVLSTEENSLSIIPVNSDGSNPSEDLLNLLTTTVSPDDVEPVHLFVIEFLSGGIKHQCLSRDHSMLDTNGLQFFDNPATFDDSALPFSDSRCLASSFKRDCADSIDSHVSYTVDSDLVPGSYVKIHSGKYKECVGRILRSTDSHYSIKLINRDGKDYRNNTGQLVRAKLLKSNLTPLQLQLVGSNLVGDSSLTLKLQPDARDISFLFYEETVNEQKIPKRYGIIRNGPDNGCLVRIQKYLSSTNVEVLFCDERGETSESSNKLCLPRKDVQFVTVRLLDDVNEKEHERRENLVAYKIHGKENFSHLLAVIASASTHVKNNSNNKNDFLKNSALAQSPVARVKKRSYTGSSSASSQNVAVEERASELDEARNNLYWYQDPHNEDIHYPCLWYGSASDPNQKIEVLKLPMQAVVLYNTAVIPENEVSQPVKVVRKYIIPLDDSILLDFRGDGSVADFYLALMDFAEYDEELSNSYYWPDFISLMLLDNNILGDWLNKIISHSLFRSPIGLRKVFLYFLCAENCGIAEDLSSEMVLAGICPQSCLELLEDILKFDSAKGPYRRGSRVGQQYQAAVYDQHPNIEDLDNCNDSPVFIPNGEAEFIEEYLGRVHSLRLKYVSTNQLLEVPENVSEFLNQFRIWLPFNLTPDQHRSFGKKVYEWYNSLQKFIALQRQKSGCRTTIATVKYLLSKGNCFADQCEGSMLFTGIDLLGSDAAIVVLGDKEYNVPLAFCRLFDYPDDIALDVLNSSKGDMEIALLKIETCLQGKATPLISCESTSPYKYYHCYQHLSYAELSFLHRSVSRSPDDMSKIWKKYHQYVSKQKSKKIVFEAGTVDMYFEQDDASSKVTERCEGTASPDETKKMFNVVDYLFLSNLYQLLFHEGTRFLVHVSYKRRSNHIARLAAGSSNQSDTAKVRDLNKPKRWPSSLPLMCHNLYWHVSQRAAYLCLGLDSGSLQSHREGHLSVTLITCGKYSQVSAIPARFLQPLDPDILTVYPNDRNLEFALAMMDFAEWELSTVSNTCSLKKWYNYPEFIHELIAKSSSWNAWRSAAERHSRGKNISRRLIYFEYLRETFLTIPGEMNLRSIDEDILCYPWDDHLSSDSEISADGSRSEALQKETLCIPPDEIASDCKFAIDFSEGKHIAKINDSNQKEHSLTDDLMLERKRVAELINQDGADTLNGNSSKYRKLTTMERYAVVPVEINSKTNFRYSALNLYWIDRSQLPCIFYDDLDRESAERFVVLPVSCSTYHYPVEVLRGAVIALNQPILRRCNDERTADFGLALMHFAELHLHSLQVGTGVEELNTENFNEEEVNEKLEFYSKMLEIDELTIQKLQKLPGMSQKESKKNYYYQWPEFIYHLINQPKWWGIWRKSVERKPNLERTARSQLYLRALFSDYDILMKAYK